MGRHGCMIKGGFMFPIIQTQPLKNLMMVFWYSPLQRVKIHQRLRFQIRRWLILWETIFLRQWNEKIVRCMTTLILAMGRIMKWMITLNICLMPLNKILEINYAYGFLTQPMEKEMFWRVTILFIYQRMDERGGLSRTTQRWTERKNILQSKWGRIFWWVI